jgi:Prokaryotic Cytochrome C oxidase subunit IV
MAGFALTGRAAEMVIRPAVVCAALVAATLVSWLLGVDHRLQSANHAAIGAIVLTIAFVKVRFVGMDFVDLRVAPRWLRLVFDGWLFLTGGVVVILFLAV